MGDWYLSLDTQSNLEASLCVFLEANFAAQENQESHGGLSSSDGLEMETTGDGMSQQ